jgi:K+-sensing histidine kinase KdpD
MPDRSDEKEATGISADAIGAFGHDVRSPLNAITMLIDVARRISDEDTLVLDQELTQMLLGSVDDIVRIVAELQEVSRLERGKTVLRIATVALEDVIETMQNVNDGISMDVEVSGTLPNGCWDEERLVAALAEMAAAANRGGGASGRVQVRIVGEATGAKVLIWCGEESGEERAVDATLGWSYFRACALLRSMGASLDARRQRGFMHVAIDLPAGDATGSCSRTHA